MVVLERLVWSMVEFEFEKETGRGLIELRDECQITSKTMNCNNISELSSVKM